MKSVHPQKHQASAVTLHTSYFCICVDLSCSIGKAQVEDSVGEYSLGNLTFPKRAAALSCVHTQEEL